MSKTLGVETVRKKGGSLIVAIPKDVIKANNFKVGDYLAFIKGSEGVYVENVQTLLDNYKRRKETDH